MKDWVNSALSHSGMSQADLARELAANYKWSENRSILNKIVTGDRDLKADEMFDISRATGFPIPAEIAHDVSVPLMGYIGAGAEIMPEFEQVPPEGLDQIHVPFPLPAEMIALEVRGDSMLPVYKEGHVIIVYKEQKRPTHAFYGEEAAVRTGDGRRFLKTIMRGAGNAVTLMSFNAGPIENVQLDWIGEIFATIPRLQVKRIEKMGGVQGRLPLGG